MPKRQVPIAAYKLVFGEEAGGKVSEIISVSVSADAEATHGRGLTYVDGISFGR